MSADRQNDKQSGAALLSVMMVVVAMSVAAVTTLDALARTVGVSREGQFRSEAIWAIRSAEALGLSYLAEFMTQTKGNVSVDTPGINETQSFATPRFGVTAQLRPASNCFNLNSLSVSDADASSAINERAQKQYINLLRSTDVFDGEAQMLADTLADWIDGDDVPRPNGAESRTYANLDVSHRSGGQMLSNITELRAIAGYTIEKLSQIGDLVCAYPTNSQNILNLNMLSLDQAPLLQVLFSEELTEEAARRLIESRPIGGWSTIQEFMELDDIQQISPRAIMIENISLQSQYYTMQVDLVSPSQSAYGDFLFEVLPEGEIATVRRREGGQR